MSAGPETVQATRLKPDGLNWLGILAGIASVALFSAGVELAVDLRTSSSLGDLFGFAIALALGYGILVRSPPAILTLAVVYFATSTSLFLSKSWAWYLSLMLAIVTLELDTAQLMLLGLPGWFGWPALGASIVIIYYLTRPNVRSFFQKQIRT